MKKIKADEFVRRLKGAVSGNAACRYAFFLGAGCSMTSGIPGAAELVKGWLPRLKKHELGDGTSWQEWTRERYPEFAGDYGNLYGPVIEALFHTPAERQQEIERICSGKDPAFGYGVLAQLVGDSEYGKNFNIILTTNFDDLIADALYVYANRKPVVITHESLIGFVTITPSKPYIIKLHGDARLTPKNINTETDRLHENVEKVLGAIFNETGLIFIGYGGNDSSIIETLERLPDTAFPYGVYWVGTRIPERVKSWLERVDAVHVEQRGFDELMVLIFEEFELPEPDNKRFETFSKTFYETYGLLREKIKKGPVGADNAAVIKAVDNAVERFRSWWSFELKARDYEQVNPNKAEEIYQEGLGHVGNEPNLLGNYALFLKKTRKDFGRAEEIFRRALAADPKHVNNLRNYATFLKDTRNDYDGADEYYRRAVAADPNDAVTLSIYAVFLSEIRKEDDRALEYFHRALVAHPNDAFALGNYAIFLKNARKDYDRADEYFQQALAAGPEDANALSNYGGFLLAVGRKKEGLEKTARALEKAESESLSLECQFYRYAHDETATQDALIRIKKLLYAGVLSPGWDLSLNVERAIEDAHPEPEFLIALAKVISGEAPLQPLEEFDVWRRTPTT